MEHFPEPVRFYRYTFEKFQISEYPFQKLFLLLFVDTGVSTSYLKKFEKDFDEAKVYFTIL